MRWAILLLLNVACSTNQSTKTTIFAAVSLQEVLDNICAQYDEINSVDVVTSYASSAALARQIAQGAPADMYLSANSHWMSFLEEQKAIVPSTKQIVASNRLALITTPHNTVSTWPNLDPEEKVAIGHPEHVPAGMYAKEALQHLELWETIGPHLLYTNNVRRALRLVEMGEATYGVVYQSDARASTNVRTMLIFPQDSHSPIEYSLAVTNTGDRPEVHKLVSYITDQHRDDAWKTRGFSNVALNHVD